MYGKDTGECPLLSGRQIEFRLNNDNDIRRLEIEKKLQGILGPEVTDVLIAWFQEAFTVSVYYKGDKFETPSVDRIRVPGNSTEEDILKAINGAITCQ